MNRFTPIIAAAAMAACAPIVPSAGPAVIPELAGRTAGAPQRCVPSPHTETLRVGDGGDLLYGSGRTIWVNHPASRCLGLNRTHIIVVEPTGSQYCSGDRVRWLDPVSHLPGPSCILGEFIPYRR